MFYTFYKSVNLRLKNTVKLFPDNAVESAYNFKYLKAYNDELHHFKVNFCGLF